jgi:hypothetical protein
VSLGMESRLPSETVFFDTHVLVYAICRFGLRRGALARRIGFDRYQYDTIERQGGGRVSWRMCWFVISTTMS